MITVGQDEWTYQCAVDWLSLPQDVPLTEAIGVAVDSQDRLFIFNRGEPSILVVSAEGRLLDHWSASRLIRPHGIWIDSADTLYLVDDIGHGVHQYSAAGEWLRSIGPSGVASESGAEGFDYRTIHRGAPPYNLPTNLVTSSTGEMFVTDGYGNARVHRFSPAGELLASWGEPGTASGCFQVPHGIGIDRQDRLYIADRENSRVQIFDTSGELLGEWTDVVRPCQVFVASDERVYVAELGRRFGLFPFHERDEQAIGSRLSIFSQGGELLARWGGGTDPTRPDEFCAAHDVWVDSRGDIYVGEVSRTAAQIPADQPAPFPSLRKFIRLPPAGR